MSEHSLKQTYLRENILERGYDPPTFVEFMSSSKAGGENIDNWKLGELMAVVARFVKQHKPAADPKQMEAENNGSDDDEPKEKTGELLSEEIEEEGRKQRITQMILEQSKEEMAEMNVVPFY